MQILFFKYYTLIFNNIMQQIYISIRFLWNILLFLDVIYLFLGIR